MCAHTSVNTTLHAIPLIKIAALTGNNTPILCKEGSTVLGEDPSEVGKILPKVETCITHFHFSKSVSILTHYHILLTAPSSSPFTPLS